MTSEWTVHDQKRSLRGFLPFCHRSEWKNVYRLVYRLYGPCDYNRFKAIALFGCKPEEHSEIEFKRLLAAYMNALFGDGRLDDLIRSDICPLECPEAYDQESLGGACGKAWEWAVSLAKAWPESVLLMNVCLARMGLGTFRIPRRPSFDPSSGLSVAAALRTTARMPESVAESAKRWDADDLLKEISPIIRSFPIDRAFLFGSHADGTQTAGSDADIAVSFQKGLDYDEKQTALTKIKAEIFHKLNTFADVREFFSDDRDAVSRFEPILEVPL